jgi:peptidoglycan hydrolase-like protein with peptidoglycan-binding domain
MLHKLKLTESEIRDILSKHGVKRNVLVEQTQDYTILDIQNWLNTNKSAGLNPDGKFGPLTAKAIKKAIIG